MCFFCAYFLHIHLIKKAPEREIAYDSLIHLEQLIASIEKDEVEMAEDSLNDG